MEYIKKNLEDIKATGYQIAGVVLTGGDNKVELLQQCNDKLKKYTDNILHETNKMHNAYKYTSGNLQRMKRRLEGVEDENKRYKQELKDSDDLFKKMRKDIDTLSSSQEKATRSSTQSSTKAVDEDILQDMQDSSFMSQLLDDSLIEPSQCKPDEEINQTEKYSD